MLLLTLLLSIANAEYRAFDLLITNSATGQERHVLTTLDHVQYRYYYPTASTETISIASSWMCWGPTYDFKKICPDPKSISAANP